MPRSRATYWVSGAVLLVAVSTISLTQPSGPLLTGISDLMQMLLVAAILAGMLANVRGASGNLRVFWMLMATGAGFWLAVQFFWSYYEILLGRQPPNPFLGDVVLFLHLVPMMAALALRPHQQRPDALRLRVLDFSLLLLWWVYLYIFLVIPWQYVWLDAPRYSLNFILLYVAENTVLVISLGLLWLRSGGAWRTIYGHFLIAAFLYAFSSEYINFAIDRGEYYSGSVYDLPLMLAMGWFAWTAFYARQVRPQRETVSPLPAPGTALPSLLAMAAVLSLPVLDFWSHQLSSTPGRVQAFRDNVTLGAILVLTFLVFLKQHLLGRQLARLLRESRESFDNFRRLQSQIAQSEKMAALGRLVAGAAHEINNPLTAILGYSDMLARQSSLPEEQRSLADKIRQQARRTRTLVLNLLSFAKQAAPEKSLLDVNVVVGNALLIRDLDIRGKNIHVERNLSPEPLPVWGDDNQLLQVCVHILSNAADALQEVGGGIIRVSTRRENDQILLEFCDTGPGLREPDRIFDPFYSTKPPGKGTGLGLSASYGIIQEHHGSIRCGNLPEGGARFVVRLPASREAAASPTVSAAPTPTGAV